MLCLIKELSSDNIASHLLEIIMLRLGLQLESCMALQQDRASTNKLALKRIKDIHDNTKPTENDCNSNTLSNTGKTINTEGNITHCFNFRKNIKK